MFLPFPEAVVSQPLWMMLTRKSLFVQSSPLSSPPFSFPLSSLPPPSPKPAEVSMAARGALSELSRLSTEDELCFRSSGCNAFSL